MGSTLSSQAGGVSSSFTRQPDHRGGHGLNEGRQRRPGDQHVAAGSIYLR